MAAVGSPERSPWSIFIEAHRAQVARHRSVAERDRVLVLARDAAFLRWIDHELFGERLSSTIVSTLADVVACVTLTAPPWPRYLVLDAAELSIADADLLAGIREAGWRGVVIAVGDGLGESFQALGADVILPRSFGCELLRNELKPLRPGSGTLG